MLLAAGMPLAYVKRSGISFFLVLLGFAISAHISMGIVLESLAALVLIGASVALLLNGYGVFHVAKRPRAEVGPTALVIGGLSLAFWSYFLSFRETAGELLQEDAWLVRGTGLAAGLLCAIFCAGVVLWTLSLRKALQGATLRPYTFAVLGSVGLMLVAGLVLREATQVVVLSNVAVIALGVGLLWCGLTSLRRSVFWLGVALIGLLILTRFIEYETGLMLKAVAFLAAGAGVMYGGIKFENLLRRKGLVHE